MSLTLGSAVNSALVEIGEPEVTDFTDINLLQRALINEANYAVRDMMSRSKFRWALHRTILPTVAEVTGYVQATNGYNILTSVTSGGVQTPPSSTLAIGSYIRIAGDYTSYRVSLVSGNYITLETRYVGDSSSAAAYRGIKDEYSFPMSDCEDVVIAQYGDANEGSARKQIEVVPLQAMAANAGGDWHLNESGKPAQMARVRPDSSDVQVWKLWPYPDSAYIIELWYTKRFTAASSFSSTVFNGDAPPLAEDAVCLRCAARALRWTKDYQEANERLQQYERAVAQLVSGQARSESRGMRVETYRMSPRGGIRAESQIAFDRA